MATLRQGVWARSCSLTQATSSSQITARMMGPRNRPVMPKEMVPPITPIRMSRVGVCSWVRNLAAERQGVCVLGDRWRNVVELAFLPIDPPVGQAQPDHYRSKTTRRSVSRGSSHSHRQRDRTTGNAGCTGSSGFTGGWRDVMESDSIPIARTAAGAGVVFSREERERHHYVVGKSGSGKSTFLYNLVMGDIVAGEGVAVTAGPESIGQQLHARLRWRRGAGEFNHSMAGTADRLLGKVSPHRATALHLLFKA